MLARPVPAAIAAPVPAAAPVRIAARASYCRFPAPAAGPAGRGAAGRGGGRGAAEGENPPPARAAPPPPPPPPPRAPPPPPPPPRPWISTCTARMIVPTIKKKNVTRFMIALWLFCL